MTLGLRFLSVCVIAFATSVASAEEQDASWLDDFDPRDPRTEQLLEEFDKIHEEETGLPSWLNLFQSSALGLMQVPDCYRENCNVFARVSKRNQMFYLSVGGNVQYAWPTSTGDEGYETPDFDRHPSGRIYDRYSSSKYPGGDWKGLGNMPYAVFIRGGYAIHGTPRANWPKLGQKASHGCIRLHPDNGRIFNRLVRANGVAGTWITVED